METKLCPECGTIRPFEEVNGKFVCSWRSVHHLKHNGHEKIRKLKTYSVVPIFKGCSCGCKEVEKWLEGINGSTGIYCKKCGKRLSSGFPIDYTKKRCNEKIMSKIDWATIKTYSVGACSIITFGKNPEETKDTCSGMWDVPTNRLLNSCYICPRLKASLSKNTIKEKP